ncbi:hypothetical protein AVEN_49952-1 [Araneus ventricosus]|uniref:Uncharacterized protein n=1 Tax=Araneus ventricosus TaxID=182803 RepID=A0A4Y2EFT2_ARAVE|nr:hypothetical protein AVEN_49952-1 [Araneus ventricosus]
MNSLCSFNDILIACDNNVKRRNNCKVELMGLKEEIISNRKVITVIRASQGNEITKIWADGLSSVMDAFDPHTLFNLFQTSSPFSHKIKISWFDGTNPMPAIGVRKKPMLSLRKPSQKAL